MDYDTETLWHEINDMPGEIYDIIDEEEEDGFSVLNFQEALKETTTSKTIKQVSQGT